MIFGGRYAGKSHQKGTRAEIHARQDDHAQAVREDHRADGADQSRRMLLKPRCGGGAEETATGECQQTAARNRAEEDLFKGHVALGHPGPRDELNHLRGGERVQTQSHCEARGRRVGCARAHIRREATLYLGNFGLHREESARHRFLPLMIGIRTGDAL